MIYGCSVCVRVHLAECRDGWEADGCLTLELVSDTILTFLLVVTKDGVYILDLAAKVDATADYICKVKWGDIYFPPPFGREAYPEVRQCWEGDGVCVCVIGPRRQ